MSIFLCAGEMTTGRPLYREIIDRARTAGLSGATVLHGLQGFGESGMLAPPALIRRTGFEPVLIEIADEPARVHAFLAGLSGLLGGGLIVLKTVTVTRRVADLPDIAATAAP
jgi:uncharacterized protein